MRFHALVFQNQYYDDVLHEVGILSKCDDLHVRHQAEIVYEFLKLKGLIVFFVIFIRSLVYLVPVYTPSRK